MAAPFRKERNMSSELTTKGFWEAAIERAIRTMAEVSLAMIPAAVTITDVDWKTVLGTAALSGLTSVLMAVATGLPEAEPVNGRHFGDE